MINGWEISCEMTPRRMSLDLSDGSGNQLGAVRQQVITCANVEPDLCCHMASPSHNVLIEMCFYLKTTLGMFVLQ